MTKEIFPMHLRLGNGYSLAPPFPHHESTLLTLGLRQKRLPAATQSWIRECLAAECLGGTRLMRSAWHAEKLLGWYGLRLFESDGLAEIDFILDWKLAAAALQLAQRATRHACASLFDTQHYNRIDITCDPDSPIDTQLAEKFGMTYELTKRCGLRKLGRDNEIISVDAPLYAMLPGEWHNVGSHRVQPD